MSEKSKLDITNRLLESIKKYPHIIQSEMKPEEFLEELNKAVTAMFESNESEILKVEIMAGVFNGIPQLIKPEIGIEAFVETMLKAFAKYTEYFRDERRTY
jgi:hypothetical protein